MGSRSTLLSSKLGGLRGRALKTGDELPVGGFNSAEPDVAYVNENAAISFPAWFVRPLALPAGDVVTLRVLSGEHSSMMSAESQLRFRDESFLIT